MSIKKWNTWLALVAVLLSTFMSVCAPEARALVNRPGATNVIVYNASNKDATAILAIGAGNLDGCPKSITGVRVIDIATGRIVTLTPFGGSSLNAWFILKRGARVQIVNMLKNPYTGQQSSCLQNFNIAFNARWTCPTGKGSSNNAFPNTTPGATFNQTLSPNPQLPNGGNAAEFSLNLPATQNGAVTLSQVNESCDLSCVNGANSQLTMTLTPPTGGPYWSVLAGAPGGGNLTLTRSFTARHSWVDLANKCDANCIDPATGFARPGVFPYGCTQCNVIPDIAPPCGASEQFCAARNGAIGNTGCLFQRSPRNVNAGTQPPQPIFGGTLMVTFMGPLSPPGTCPPGTRN